jgi:hypothetical protein
MKKNQKWENGFQLINESIRVSGDDSALGCDDDDYEVVRCHCKERDDGGLCCLDESCLNWATQTECIKCLKSCGNNRLLRKKFKNLEVREADGKGFGVFTLENLKKNDLLMEYFGEIISEKELQQRFSVLENKQHLYIMQIKAKTYVDARFKGGIARFINHSCEPNCRLEIWTVKDRLRLAIFAKKEIKENDELSFDYQWKPSDRSPTVCLCGTKSCRGYLEVYDAKTKQKNTPLSVLQGKTGSWISCRERQFVLSPSLSTGDLQATTTLPTDGDPTTPVTPASSASASSSSLSLSMFDEEGKVLPERIIGKYIKYWNEEQSYFMEMRIDDYNSIEDSYEGYDLLRKNTFPLNLNNPSILWYYFDESSAAKAIRKKVLFLCFFTVSS